MTAEHVSSSPKARKPNIHQALEKHCKIPHAAAACSHMVPSPFISIQGEHKELDSKEAQEQELPSTAFPTTQSLSHPTEWGHLLKGAQPHCPSRLPPSRLILQSEKFSLVSL